MKSYHLSFERATYTEHNGRNPVRLLKDGNVLGGSFRLGFSGYTTSTIAYDATASELGVALTDLPSIDSVEVRCTMHGPVAL